jgi:hypothetical protein
MSSGTTGGSGAVRAAEAAAAAAAAAEGRGAAAQEDGEGEGASGAAPLPREGDRARAATSRGDRPIRSIQRGGPPARTRPPRHLAAAAAAPAVTGRLALGADAAAGIEADADDGASISLPSIPRALARATRARIGFCA